jgi:serine/threonine-protein kinase
VAQQRLGTIIEDDLRIETVIGGGPHGVVYHATGADHRSAALKVLAPGIVDRVDRFEVAPRASHHPGLVEIERVGQLDDGAIFLVSRLVHGDDVATVLADGPLPPAQALRVVRLALDALRAAHEEGVAHGDLKPENLMVSAGDELVHVLDLALGGLLRAPKPTERVAAPAYRAPETIITGLATPRADLYAMGVVLAEMLSGEPLSTSVVFDARWTEALSFLIWKSVQRDPRDRYRDATEMIAAVDNALRSLERYRPGS